MFGCQKYSQGIKLIHIDSIVTLKIFVVNRRTGLAWKEGIRLKVWAPGPLKTGPLFPRNVGSYLPIYAATSPIKVKIFMKKLTRWSDEEFAERTASDTIRN